MSLLHDAYTAYLAGLTIKTGNEIHWTDNKGTPVTIEPLRLKTERYIMRYYNQKGLIAAHVYQGDRLCTITYYCSGKKYEYIEYNKDGHVHGRLIKWIDGNKIITKYKNGIKVRKPNDYLV